MSVLFESSQIFLQYRRHRRKKWTRILKFEFCGFWEFLKFSKRHCAVPLRPIWTSMVAATLDQSRVLVTKFHQNRSTLKGRSTGQRQTEEKKTENNGPSCLQSGQQPGPLIPEGSLSEHVYEENQGGTCQPRFTWKMAVKMVVCMQHTPSRLPSRDKWPKNSRTSPLQQPQDWLYVSHSL